MQQSPRGHQLLGQGTQGPNQNLQVDTFTPLIFGLVFVNLDIQVLMPIFDWPARLLFQAIGLHYCMSVVGQ